jgi:cytochrome c-type biogenesis protein CcmF
VTFLGTNFPIFSEIITGEQITVGEPFYQNLNGKLFAVLLLLMGIAPMTMWYRTSAKRLGLALRWPALAAVVFVAVLFAMGMRSWGALLGFWIVSFSLILTILEFVKGTRARMKRGENALSAFSSLLSRNRRRYGGYWIHLGVIIMGFGIIGSDMFQQQRQILLQRGESAELGEFRVVFNGAEQYAGPDDLLVTEANLSLFKGDRLLTTLTPHNELYTRTNQPMTIPDLRATVTEDFYVLMINWEGMSADQATFRLYINPLINWVWAGAFVFMFGTMIAAWPDAAEERMMAAARRSAPTVAYS